MADAALAGAGTTLLPVAAADAAAPPEDATGTSGDDALVPAHVLVALPLASYAGGAERAAIAAEDPAAAPSAEVPAAADDVLAEPEDPAAAPSAEVLAAGVEPTPQESEDPAAAPEEPPALLDVDACEDSVKALDAAGACYMPLKASGAPPAVEPTPAEAAAMAAE